MNLLKFYILRYSYLVKELIITVEINSKEYTVLHISKDQIENCIKEDIDLPYSDDYPKNKVRKHYFDQISEKNKKIQNFKKIVFSPKNSYFYVFFGDYYFTFSLERFRYVYLLDKIRITGTDEPIQSNSRSF